MYQNGRKTITHPTPPNTEYLEMNFVGETATGRGNNQKFVMENLHDGTFRATESRIGITVGRHKPRSFTYPMDRWQSLYETKVNRGYLLTKTTKMDKKIIQENSSILNVNGIRYQPIEDKSVNEIVTRLLEFINNVFSTNYTIKVDDISDEMISYGRNTLNELALSFEKMSVAEFNNKLKTLYAAIPRRMDNLSKHLAKRKVEFQDIVAQEQELFDLMVSRVRSGQFLSGFSKPKTILDAYDLEWRDVTEDEEKWIRKKLEGSASSYRHAWKITNNRTKKRFDSFCLANSLSEEDGISHLFHGSRNENFWSIITNGLTINPTNVVISGKMFGNGTYFAPLAKKSLGYTSRSGSIWAKGTQDCGFLAICKVATGKCYDLTGAQSDLNWKRLQERCPGAHCTWAHAGHQLYNDEVIVYQDEQSTLEYLIEMSS